MTDNNHPITPPLKLFREWTEYRGAECEDQFWWRIATEAARWGFKQCIELDSAELEVKLQKARDEELEACINYFHEYDTSWGEDSDLIAGLRAARRPKPPSLKEQALAELELLRGDANAHGLGFDAPAIRRALEALPD